MLSRCLARQARLGATITQSQRLVSRPASTTSNSSSSASKDDTTKPSAKSSESQPTKKKTQAELDKELEAKMQGLAGDGGESGVDYEDGKPAAMKRSVRENMFRYI